MVQVLFGMFVPAMAGGSDSGAGATVAAPGLRGYDDDVQALMAAWRDNVGLALRS